MAFSSPPSCFPWAGKLRQGRERRREKESIMGRRRRRKEGRDSFFFGGRVAVFK